MNKSYIQYDNDRNEYCIITISYNHYKVLKNNKDVEHFDIYEEAQHFIDKETL